MRRLGGLIANVDALEKKLLLLLEIEKYSLGLPARSHVTIVHVLSWPLRQIKLLKIDCILGCHEKVYRN
jgi:hypothetical protein